MKTRQMGGQQKKTLNSPSSLQRRGGIRGKPPTLASELQKRLKSMAPNANTRYTQKIETGIKDTLSKLSPEVRARIKTTGFALN